MSSKKLPLPPSLARVVEEAVETIHAEAHRLAAEAEVEVTPKYPLHWTLHPDGDGGWIKGSTKYPQSFADYFHPQRAYVHAMTKPASATEWWKPPTVDEAIAQVRAMAAKKGIEGLAEWLPISAPTDEPSPPATERVTPATHDNIPADWVNQYGLTLALQNQLERDDNLEYGPPAARPGVAH